VGDLCGALPAGQQAEHIVSVAASFTAKNSAKQQHHQQIGRASYRYLINIEGSATRAAKQIHRDYSFFDTVPVKELNSLTASENPRAAVLYAFKSPACISQCACIRRFGEHEAGGNWFDCF
jgi:hypothetical protein